CFAAIQSTYKGPFTPGSAFCLVYTMALNGGGGLMRRVKGGMGSLAEALTRSIAAKGGEVRLKQTVKRIVVEEGRAVGVELRTGECLRARAVLSNLDKPATFLRLLGEEHLSDEFLEGVRGIEHKGAWVHSSSSSMGCQNTEVSGSRSIAMCTRDLVARWCRTRRRCRRATRHASAASYPNTCPSPFRFPASWIPVWPLRVSTLRAPTDSSFLVTRRTPSAASCATRWPSV
ncbi:MAG: FAD-dependent oxidoreductase, partial [Deltaproteobacteria bacterium]|nr:FAD-dependent oxidoreductase [Deltaproteobacteria bacterium]